MVTKVELFCHILLTYLKCQGFFGSFGSFQIFPLIKNFDFAPATILTICLLPPGMASVSVWKHNYFKFIDIYPSIFSIHHNAKAKPSNAQKKRVFLGRIVGKVIAFDPLNLFAPLGGKGCWVNKVVDPARSVHEKDPEYKSLVKILYVGANDAKRCT